MFGDKRLGWTAPFRRVGQQLMTATEKHRHLPINGAIIGARHWLEQLPGSTTLASLAPPLMENHKDFLNASTKKPKNLIPESTVDISAALLEQIRGCLNALELIVNG